MIGLAVAFALASAATTALSTSTQHLATGKAPEGAGVVDLIRFLVRRPAWLAALLLGPVGFTFHVLALHHGPLALVQPLAITGIVFAVPIRAALSRSWPSLAELVAVTVTAAALTVLLLASDVRAAGHAPDLLPLLLGCATAASGAVALVVVAGGVPHPTARGFLLGCASGLLFGLMAVLIEACQLHLEAHGVLRLATSGLPCATVAAGLSGICVNQVAYRAARLSASMPALNVVNCLVTLAFGYVVLGERPPTHPVALVATGVALAAVAWSLWRLAAVEERRAAPAPEPALVR